MNNTVKNNEIVTVAEVAKELDITAQTVYKMIRRGILKYTKRRRGLSYMYIIKKSDLIELKKEFNK